MALSPGTIAAAKRYGPSVNSIAEQYGISGAALLAKLVQGESHDDPNAISGAGARGRAQFTSASRQTAVQKYGVDPWSSSPDQAVHAAALHLLGKINGSTGLKGYNPGDPSYTSYILGQKVGNVSGGASPAGVQPQANMSAAPAASSSQGPQMLDAGQGSDFTSLLGSLLAKPQPAQQGPTPLQAPAFAAAPKLPGGFQAMMPTAAAAPPSQGGVSDALGLVAALGGSGPSVGTSGGSQTADGPQMGQPSASSPNAGGTGADAALSWAKSKIGFKETGTNSGGLASYANQRFGMSNQPWCAMFTSLAVTKGGAPKSARTASVATVRSKAQAGDGYEKGFVDPRSAQSGDLILFGNDHIGMVDHVNGGKIVYVGGNQSNGVTQASVAVGTGDIVRPKYGARQR